MEIPCLTFERLEFMDEAKAIRYEEHLSATDGEPDNPFQRRALSVRRTGSVVVVSRQDSLTPDHAEYLFREQYQTYLDPGLFKFGQRRSQLDGFDPPLAPPNGDIQVRG